LVDGQPTAFRAAMEDDLMPTFKRLQQKHPSAEMKWFQNGKLWGSRLEAKEAMQMRGDRGRMGDARQGGFRDRKSTSRPIDPPAEIERDPEGKLAWKPKGEFTPAPKRSDREDRPEWKSKSSAGRDRKPAWKPKGSFDGERKPDRRAKSSFDRESKPEWKSKGSFDRDHKPEWKPKGSFDRERKPEWKPKGSFDRERKPEWKPKGSFDRERKPEWKPKDSFDRERPARPRSTARPRTSGKLDWTPKSGHTGAKPAGAPEKRKWIPKEEYKKSQGIEARRDKNWRPGGEHKDPRQKYKDAKKAKWTKFKANVRQRWEKKGGTKPPSKKRRDEE
jgi:hypothetical protein